MRMDFDSLLDIYTGGSEVWIEYLNLYTTHKLSSNTGTDSDINFVWIACIQIKEGMKHPLFLVKIGMRLV